MAGNNRMVEKSKSAIKNALLELMYDKDFKDITVNELLKKANISRGTFYAHFQNLDDVREQLISDLYGHADFIFADTSPSDLYRDPYEVMLMAAQFMQASRDPAKRMFKFINVYDLGVHLKTWLTRWILSDDALVEKFGGFEDASIYARYIAGGIMHAYNVWILQDFDVPPEKLVSCLHKILMDGLHGFEKTGSEEA